MADEVAWTSWHSYGKIYAVGHREVKDIWMKTVTIEEKIDGSQFSFGLIEGRLRIKSHHQDISDIVGEWGLFTEAIAYVRSLHADGKLTPGWTYRGEVIQKPKHNKLEYERVPRHNIIGFDIATGEENYLNYTDKVAAFGKLDLETVPYYYYGIVSNPDTIKTLLDRRPYLGGKMIEGVVIKAYGVYGEDKKTLMAKFVSEKYKEVKPVEGTGKDFLQKLIETYRTEARWDKARQYLKEKGELSGEPKDIGPLIGRIVADLKEEEGEAIAAKLMKRYWPHVARGCTGGAAEWYKRSLMEGSFVQDKDGPVEAPGPIPVEGARPGPGEAPKAEPATLG